MGDNGPRLEREEGVLGYWACPGGVEYLYRNGKLSVEVGGCLARRLAHVQSGTGNGDVHTDGQCVLTAIWDITRASLPSVLDTRKAYNTLDRGQYLKVLQRYGMRPNLAQLLMYYWEWQRIMPNMGKFLGK